MLAPLGKIARARHQQSAIDRRSPLTQQIADDCGASRVPNQDHSAGMISVFQFGEHGCHRIDDFRCPVVTRGVAADAIGAVFAIAVAGSKDRRDNGIGCRGSHLLGESVLVRRRSVRRIPMHNDHQDRVLAQMGILINFRLDALCRVYPHCRIGVRRVLGRRCRRSPEERTAKQRKCGYDTAHSLNLLTTSARSKSED